MANSDNSDDSDNGEFQTNTASEGCENNFIMLLDSYWYCLIVKCE